MRVLVELLDREPLKNIYAPCVFRPDIVVYLCDTRDGDFFKESAIYRLFKRRRLKTLPRFYYFDATDPAGIRRVLGAVVRDYPGCVFDFTGGRELVLLVAGTCFAEMGLPGFYIDISRGRFINIRGCDEAARQFRVPAFDVEDVLAMTGATIHGHGHFSPEETTPDFDDDALAVFAIVRKNPKAWGEWVAWLQHICSGTPSGRLEAEGPRRAKGGRSAVHANPVLLQNLSQAGVISRLSITKSHVKFSFKSALHRKCLLIEGVWLELYCYVVAKRSGWFTDVRTSVVVDWDGVDGGSNTAKNEVDVLLVKDVFAVFVSCKMSLPSALTLSEIKLLSGKFGGRYSQPVVLCAGRYAENNLALRSRAEDLGIHLLDIEDTADGALLERLKRIVYPDYTAPRLSGTGMPPDALTV